jgi:hypothetical protein
MRLKSSMTGNPLEYFNSSGTTVQPRRTPVNPANLEKDEISIATYVTKTPNSIISQEKGASHQMQRQELV